MGQSGGRRPAVVEVQVAACGLDQGAAEEVLEGVQRDASVGRLGCAGLPGAVADEIGQAEVADDLIPVRRVPHERGGERAAFGPD